MQVVGWTHPKVHPAIAMQDWLRYAERHADLGLSPSDVEGDVFITAYDVPTED